MEGLCACYMATHLEMLSRPSKLLLCKLTSSSSVVLGFYFLHSWRSGTNGRDYGDNDMQRGKVANDIYCDKILRKCQSKFDCLIYEMLFIKQTVRLNLYKVIYILIYFYSIYYFNTYILAPLVTYFIVDILTLYFVLIYIHISFAFTST